MREFTDDEGHTWTASVVERLGPNYKGRFSLHMTTGESDGLTLDDVAWNSRHTAERTLTTMSTTELKRRLRIGQGRQAAVRLP